MPDPTITVLPGWRAPGGREDGNSSRLYGVYQVDSTAYLTDAAALAADGIPEIGDAHPEAAPLTCAERHVSKREGPCSVIITVGWELSNTRPPRQTNPLNELPEIEYDWETSSEPLWKDAAGNAISNSAGDPFDPPATDEVRDRVVRVTRNETAVAAAAALYYDNSVNSDTFSGYAAGKVRLRTKTRLMRQGTTEYYRTAYELTFRDEDDAWKLKIRDQGYRYLSKNPLLGIQPFNEPSPQDLTAEGHALIPGAEVNWKKFARRGVKSLAFAALGLPTLLVPTPPP